MSPAKNFLSFESARFGKSKEHLKIHLLGKNLSDRQIKIEAIKFFVEKEVRRQPDFFNSATVEKIFIELDTNNFDDCKNLRDKDSLIIE